MLFKNNMERKSAYMGLIQIHCNICYKTTQAISELMLQYFEE